MKIATSDCQYSIPNKGMLTSWYSFLITGTYYFCPKHVYIRHGPLQKIYSEACIERAHSGKAVVSA